MHIYIYTYIYIYTHIHIYIHVYTSTYLIYKNTYTYLHIAYIRMYIRKDHMCAYMYELGRAFSFTPKQLLCHMFSFQWLLLDFR